MATIGELEYQKRILEAQITRLIGGRQSGVQERIRALAATEQIIEQARAAGDTATVNRELAVAAQIREQIDAGNLEIANLRSEVNVIEQELVNLRREQASQDAAKTTNQNGATSAGDTVVASDDAGVINPAKQTETIAPEGRIVNRNPAGTNADAALTTTTPEGVTVTNTSDRKIGETQAPINAPNTGEIKRLVDEPPPDPTTPPPGAYGPGVGEVSEDARATKNLTRQDIELNFSEDIRPQANILDKYASYTYQISWFLLNEADYRNVVTSERWEIGGTGIDGGQLLMQSGGIKQQGQVTATIDGQASGQVNSRSPYFPLDFYIDSLSVTNLFQGKATGTASSYTDLKMTVVEPNGISLIDNLKKAITNYCGIQAFASAIYCIVIKWIGYDENGNIVYAGNTNSGAGTTDPYAIAIKYIPFAINNIKFSVSNRLTTYEISGSPLIYMFRLRQTVPYNTEISGKTVQEILGGSVTAGASVTEARANGSFPTASNAATLRGAIDSAAGVTVAKPSNSIDTPQAINTSPGGTDNAGRGIMAAMNQYQQQLVKEQIYEIADEFYIEFANSTIANATVKKPGDLALDKTPMGPSSTRNLLPETAKVFNTYRNFGITAGQSVVQVIEMVVRNSSYIVDQQLKIIDEETQQERENGTPIQNFAWFKISCRAIPKGYDRKRNDYAYKFIFTLSIYEVKSSNSVWFPRTRFRGVHKSYPYWFTGRNTAVLDYQQSFDNLYNTVISGAGDQIIGDYTSALTDVPRFVYQPRSGQSSQGADQATNEPAANAADYLYSPTDIGKVKVKILGDPAWMQQGEILRGNDARTFNFSAFNADGTINFESQEVLFEIVWQRPVDYDITGQGIMDPNRYAPTNSTGALPASLSGVQSYVFYATQCTSEFRQGRFEQTLEGGLYIFPRSKTSQINASAANTGSVGTGASGFPIQSSVITTNSPTSQTFPVRGRDY